MKTLLAIILGYVVWTVLWLLGNAALSGAGLLPADKSARVDSTLALVSLLLLSVVCSIAAGVTARWIDLSHLGRATAVLGVLLLATGIAVQWNLRALMPVWYHVVFLALLVPATWVGAYQIAGAIHR